MATDTDSKKSKKGFLRRKSKSSQGSVQPSVDGDEASHSSKKSWRKKLSKKKEKSVRNGKGPNEMSSQNDTAIVQGSAGTDQQAGVQQAFLNNTETKKPYMLKVALLLVDAATRRFELLQLEFDSDKALVSDALSQIPIHVTEKVLSSQSYSGVCAADGVEKRRSVALFDFCKGNDVLVAIPAGTSAEECARLAKPILSDDKVIGMLSTSGIDADPWTSAPIVAPRSSSKSRQVKPAQRAKKESSSSSSSSMLYYVILAVLLLALAYWYWGRDQTPGLIGTGASPLRFWPKKGASDPVWNTCNSICDAGRGLVDSFLADPSPK